MNDNLLNTMQNFVNISLSGYPFSLHLNAYDELRRYLDALIDHLGSGSETEDIIENIEARIAELIAERIEKDQAVSIEVIQQVIEIIGQPEDIDEEGGNLDSEPVRDFDTSIERNKMRLYRDIDNKVFSGVCAGLAARFGIDMWIVRVLFLALIVAYGFGLLLYIALWIAVPAAATPLQKLDMQGKPLSFDSIRREVNTQYEQAKKGMRGKFSGGATSSDNFFTRFMYALVTIFFGFIKLILKIAAVIIMLALSFVFLVFILVFFSVMFGTFHVGGGALDISRWDYLWDWMHLCSSPTLLWLGVFITAIVPLIVVFMLALRMLHRYKIGKGFVLFLLISWIAGVTLSLIVAGSTQLYMSRHKANFSQTYHIPTVDKDTLRIEPADFADLPSQAWRYNGGWVIDKISFKPVTLSVVPTHNDQARVSVAKHGYFSRDVSRSMMRDKLHWLANCKPDVDTSRVGVQNTYIGYEEEGNLALQRVKIKVYVPENQYFRIDPTLSPFISSFSEFYWMDPEDITASVWIFRDGELERAKSELPVQEPVTL